MTDTERQLPEADLAYYQQRLDRAQALLREAGIDWVLIGPSADLIYLTSFDAHLSERLNLLMLPAEGSPALVVPTLEAPLVGLAGELASLHTWDDHENPVALVKEIIGDAKGKKLAVGNQLWSAFLLRIQAELPGGAWVESVPVLRSLRMQKDALEEENLQQAATRTDEAWEEFIQSGPISGLTETEAMQRLRELTEKRGVKNVWGICASGPNSASPHHATGDRVIEQGDAVIFDWGGQYEGYFSDVTRTVHIGEPSDEFVRVYDIVREANQATLEAVKPGVSLESLDQVARAVIMKAGYGKAFLHRVGHGLGMEVHEEPYLVEGNTLPLEVGMVFSDEPGIYLEGRFGVRIEDSVICTEDGGKRLNEAIRDLIVMG
ncbi:MAG TPA: Xaa-Pro peptidase family protein [Thermomicrobiales bacterium]|nr:Xaa-Pro peptidase family protein [Thermomicrobiales bacterium]